MLENHFKLVLIFISIFVSGCATTYTYKNQKYASGVAMLEAQKLFLEQKLSEVESYDSPEHGTAIFYLPSFNRFVTTGVVTKSPDSDAAFNVAKSLENAYIFMYEGLKKRNIFKNVTLLRNDQKVAPKHKNDTVVSFHLDSKTVARWSMVPVNTEKPVPVYIHTSELDETKKLHSWLESIESNMKLSQLEDRPKQIREIVKDHDLDEKVESQSSKPTAKLKTYKGNGKWKKKIKTDPITDEKVINVRINSDQYSASYRQQTLLSVRCENGNIDVIVYFDDYLGNEVVVISRVGKEKAFELKWDISTNSKAAFYPLDTTDLYYRLISNDTFAARTTPYNENPKTLTFDIRGLENILNPHLNTCGL